jgi:hypothetical protein
MSDSDKGMGRRGLMVVAIVALVVVGAAVAAQMLGWWRPGTSSADTQLAPAGPEVRAYFGELTDGTKIERWTLVSVHEVRAGAIPVVLATADGQKYNVDLLRLDPAGPKAVATTTAIALYLANAPNADGSAMTPEEQGLGIMALAAKLTSRENAGAKAPKLSSLNERISAYPDRHHARPN